MHMKAERWRVLGICMEAAQLQFGGFIDEAQNPKNFDTMLKLEICEMEISLYCVIE